MFWYRIMWVRDGISLSCLLSAAIAGLSFILCSFVLWPGEFYVSGLFLLLPLGLFNSLLELTTRTFLTCELSFKSSAHLPVLSLKSHILWIQFSLCFWCLFFRRDMLAMGSQPAPLMHFKFTSHSGSGGLVHIYPASCSATTGPLGKPCHQLSVVHSVLPHPMLCKAPGTCAADHDHLKVWVMWCRGSGKLAILGGCCFPHGLTKLCMLGHTFSPKWNPSKPTAGFWPD